MNPPPPIPMQWDGEAFRPLQRFGRLCDRHYVVGETYSLLPHEERSQASHNHFFAALAEAWHNLPEDMADRWPNVESFRKWLLISCGYADERSIVCASKAEAQRVAAFVRPMDEYAVVTVSEAVVKVYTAQSQSMRAMGKKAFAESKQACLDKAASLVGVSPDALARNSGKAA